MFKLFLAILIIGFISSRSVERMEKLDCPFKNATGEPCKRSIEFLKKYRLPVIFRSNEEKWCCYETECLAQCGIHLKTIKESKWSMFLDICNSLFYLNFDFFMKNANRPLMDRTTKKKYVEAWLIKVVHFYLSKGNVTVARSLMDFPDKP